MHQLHLVNGLNYRQATLYEAQGMFNKQWPGKIRFVNSIQSKIELKKSELNVVSSVQTTYSFRQQVL